MGALANEQSGLVPPNHHTHMGRYLAELRTYYGLSIDDVAHKLRFRARYIQAIEEGNLKELPGKVYARGYVYKYAEFLGLNGAETVEDYAELSAAQPAANDFILTPEETEQLRPKRWALWAPAAVVVALLALWLITPSGDYGRDVPLADAILSDTNPASTDLIVRPSAHSCAEAGTGSALPCWELSVQQPMHGFSPRTPETNMMAAK